MNQAHRKSFRKHTCTISHNIDGETDYHKLKFRGNCKNCLIKCANTVSKELIFHIIDKHTEGKNQEPTTLLKVNCSVFKLDKNLHFPMGEKIFRQITVLNLAVLS